MNKNQENLVAAIPQRSVGPIKIFGPVVNDEIMVPLATLEAPLWPSTERGARVTYRSGGISVTIVNERMTRSILLQAPDATKAYEFVSSIVAQKEDLARVVGATGRFARLLDIHPRIVANLVYIRVEISTGDAAGHNMATLAAEGIMNWILEHYPLLDYISISGNYCTDKKVSAVNCILGRGKHVVAETTIPRKLCVRYLKARPEKIVDLNIKKNLIGSMLAGGVLSANAHFANILLAFYLATGQDAANIVEGSQGIVHTEVKNDDLYFSTTLPNIIVGSVGSGKDLEFVQQNLTQLGCVKNRAPGDNARRLAVIAGASVLCGELSLLAALTNSGELMSTHTRLERA